MAACSYGKELKGVYPQALVWSAMSVKTNVKLE